MKMRRLIALLLLVLMPVPVFAESPGDHEMVLSVKPVLCITDKRTPSCHTAFLVAWQSNLHGYYCLFNDFTKAPLQCWSDDRDGELNDERTVDESFSYWMTGDDSGVKLAVAAVEVLRLDSSDRRRKRRTRHVWDFN